MLSEVRSSKAWERMAGGAVRSAAFRIENIMRSLHTSVWALTALVIILPALAGTPGSFRGTIVQDGRLNPERNWIYVQGRNGMVRRVEISHARVDYDDSVPVGKRLSRPQNALIAGTEVRVTAQEGTDGEWRAIRIEILEQASAVSTRDSAEVTTGP